MIFKGKGSVWDTRKNRELCTFVDGKYETTDPTEIGFLVNHGHDHDGVYEEPKKVEPKKVVIPKVEPKAPIKKVVQKKAGK